MLNNKIFITGGSGYVGSRLITELLKHNYEVTVLVRKGSENKIPARCKIVTGNALDESSFENEIAPADTFIQLVGVSHPSPSKALEFNNIDLKSAKVSASAAKKSGVKHFIYLSVAQPAPIMKEYIRIRSEAEKLILDSGMNASFIRPWYIVGPGHRWPLILKPMYWLLKRIPSTSETAKRLDLVTLEQIISTFLFAVKNPPDGVKIYESTAIRGYGT